MFRGIIIRTYPYGEADLVLRIISAEAGKLSIIAKHARSSKRRFSGGIDIFDCGEFETKTGRGSMPALDHFIPKDSFKEIRENLDKLNVASLVCECFDLLTHEGSDDTSEVFEMFFLTLEGISKALDSRECLRAGFLGIASLLKYSGYLSTPNLPPPSANALYKLLDQVEAVAEKRLLSRQGLSMTIDMLK